jgi:predicted N-formylglutamate amidohydrolase
MTKSAALLDPSEPPAFEVVNREGSSAFFLLCDHASKRMPRALGTLGLGPEELEAHIAWDIGAAALATKLSSELDAPLVKSGYSRLAIDNNRPLHVPSSIPRVTCGIVVPGNEGLSDEECARRQEELFWPYHRAIAAALAEREERGKRSVIVSLHSFTPSLYGKDRPWHMGVMYGRDRRLADLFLDELRRDVSLVVGENEPYIVNDETDYGVPTYAEKPGRLGVLLEIRQDTISAPSGVEETGARLAAVMRKIAARLDT